ncbi:hypothetical protein [Micromonospora sp. KC213]|uniref:allene oxide cyclase barrel-like domain-containing protein n=1 Tax=Micromonospora sp. KC213 TaxID=2530378 RepID=UPI00104D663F|nr:hypothetical protein [Micromonospora sp. KC213]TDC36082.1 hypothetical protein E1166_22820 [Micromonospora sp. KC213]
MRVRYTPALAAIVAGATGTALAVSSAPAGGATNSAASRHSRTVTITAVEKGASVNFVDVAPSDSALGDQLIGTGDLVGADGRKIGTSSFQGISTNAKPRTSEMLTFVYELPDGKITTAGTATLSATRPIFDEQFAITGGTGRYQDARGQVRVVQETVEQAKVTFHIKL